MSIRVYNNDIIEKDTDGGYLWISNSGEDQHFDDLSELLNYAAEYEPAAYKQVLESIN